jgi:hypothetical protein
VLCTKKEKEENINLLSTSQVPMVIVNLLMAPASFVHAIQMVSTQNELADKFIFGSFLTNTRNLLITRRHQEARL